MTKAVLLCQQEGCSNRKRPVKGARYCEEHQPVKRRALCRWGSCTNPSGGRARRYCDEHQAIARAATKARCSKAWGAAHPDNRRARLWTRYRLTIEEFDQILTDQGGRCAICETDSPKGEWHVDHNHECCPGRRSCGVCVRGILCPRCNRGILAVIEGPHFDAALAYLQGPKGDTVPSAHRWGTNAALIKDVAKLGYLEGKVADVTFGEGVFWKKWRPADLVTSDLKPGADMVADFTNLPYADDTFNSVVLDAPYKLNGTPSGDVDARYGVDVVAPWRDRMHLCYIGATECARVLKPGGYLLWKCQDQVCSGAVRWQTIDFSNHAVIGLGLDLVDRFDMLGTSRPQPAGRNQVHAHGRPSTLLVFQKPTNKRNQTCP